MTEMAKLALINKKKEDADLMSLISDFEVNNRKQVYIDDYKLLDRKSEYSSESINKQKLKRRPLAKLKVMILIIFISSLTQTILYVFILPNSFSWPDKVVPFFLVFIWIMLFNTTFFIPGVVKIIANYLNEAFTDYDCL